MAHTLSAKKRIRQNEKCRARNRHRKRTIKDQVKTFLDAVQDGDLPKATEAYQQTTKVLDQVAAKGTIHPNNAARHKSRLAKRLNALKAAQA